MFQYCYEVIFNRIEVNVKGNKIKYMDSSRVKTLVHIWSERNKVAFIFITKIFVLQNLYYMIQLI